MDSLLASVQVSTFANRYLGYIVIVILTAFAKANLGIRFLKMLKTKTILVELANKILSIFDAKIVKIKKKKILKISLMYI